MNNDNALLVTASGMRWHFGGNPASFPARKDLQLTAQPRQDLRLGPNMSHAEEIISLSAKNCEGIGIGGCFRKP